MDLETVFAYLDKDKSKGISLSELSQGLKKAGLSPEECKILFIAADKDKSNQVTYSELINEC